MIALPQRKPPRLPGYDYCTAGAYFITICAKNRRCIFGSILPTGVGGDACIAPQVTPTPLGRLVQKHLSAIPGVTEYVVMPNHLHCLIVFSDGETAGGPMQASAPTHVDSSLTVGADACIRPLQPCHYRTITGQTNTLPLQNTLV